MDVLAELVVDALLVEAAVLELLAVVEDVEAFTVVVNVVELAWTVVAVSVTDEAEVVDALVVEVVVVA